jgi:hypothetical protein
MAIRIRKVEGSRLYTAQLILPDMPAVKSAWSTPEPMERNQLIEELRKRGAHQTDIGDAFYEADPDWLTK